MSTNSSKLGILYKPSTTQSGYRVDDLKHGVPLAEASGQRRKALKGLEKQSLVRVFDKFHYTKVFTDDVHGR